MEIFEYLHIKPQPNWNGPVYADFLFFIIFDHETSCASMHWLVEKHNTEREREREREREKSRGATYMLTTCLTSIG